MVKACEVFQTSVLEVPTKLGRAAISDIEGRPKYKGGQSELWFNNF